MRFNKTIKKTQRTHTVALFFLVLFQILFLVLINWILGVLAKESGGSYNAASVKLMVSVFAGVVFAVCDVFFLYKKIILLRSLLHVVPTKCRIEDFLLIAYTDDGKRKYRVYPILRSAQDGKLYLSYGANALSNFNMKSCYNNNTLIDFAVYTQDKIPMEIGSTVYMYSLKVLDVSVDIEEAKNRVRLNKKPIPFHHINDAVEISVFKDITFFQGIVDSE